MRRCHFRLMCFLSFFLSLEEIQETPRPPKECPKKDKEKKRNRTRKVGQARRRCLAAGFCGRFFCARAVSRSLAGRPPLHGPKKERKQKVGTAKKLLVKAGRFRQPEDAPAGATTARLLPVGARPSSAHTQRCPSKRSSRKRKHKPALYQKKRKHLLVGIAVAFCLF